MSMPPPSDALVNGLRERNQAAWNEFVSLAQVPVYRFMYSQLKERTQAEDAAQETFVALLGRLDQVPTANFWGWVFGVASHKAIDQHRRARLRVMTALPSEWVDGREAAPSDRVEIEDEYHRVRRALSELPDQGGQLLLLKYQVGLTYPELAKATGSPIGTLKTKVAQLLRTLRDHLNCQRSTQEFPTGADNSDGK